MGPKKQIKKQVIEEPPKEVEPQIPLHQLQGYGRFDYQGGAYYQGTWKLIKGIKLKHGTGTLFVQPSALSPSGKEMYEGNWEEDKMQGEGTYYYSDGSIYRGLWKNNQHHGKGVYQFANATVYQGEWQYNLMHGTGFFIDHNGKKWNGQYRRGIFESKGQDELIKQKIIATKKIEIKKEVVSTVHLLLQAIAKSDKKTLKDNLSPFFASGDILKQYLRDPYSKFDERPAEKWTDLMNIAKNGDLRIINNSSQATLIPADRILGKQLEGNGQFVEIVGSSNDKIAKIGFVGLEGKWIVVLAIEEEKKK